MGVGANQSYMGISGLQNANSGFNQFGQLLRRPAPEPVQPSMVEAMIARANQAQANVNVPTLNELFPGLSNPNVMPTMQGTGMGNVYQQPINTLSNQFFAPYLKGKSANKQPSMADQLILRAQNAEQYAAPPTASQLFPMMSFNAAPMTDMSSSGAGRFVGGLSTK